MSVRLFRCTRNTLLSQRWFLGLASDLHVHATPCKHDANTMQARCKPAMQRYPVNASPHASPSTCTCKPDASPMQARASTCSHMQVRDCNTNSHATHIICNSHTQQTHTTLTHATLCCNSHMQHHMHSELIQPDYIWACTDYFSGLHVQLRCKAHAAISRDCKHACTGLASYLHRVCIVFAS